MARFSRRRFLEDSMLAAAAAAAVPVTSAFAGEKQSSSPNEKLGVAVVGCGGRGGDHLQRLRQPQGHRDALRRRCRREDRQPAGRGGRQEAGPQAASASRDMRKAFDDKSVDIVSIATPNHWHALAAIWAMQAGKDVYVEKPVSHNVSEGRRMVEAARKYNRICQTGTQCRSMKGTIDAIEYVQAGKIGEVKLARGLCYKRRGSIGPKGDYQVPAGGRLQPLVRPGADAAADAAEVPLRLALAAGTTATATWATRASTRWTSPAGAWASIELADSVISYGGRLGYEDAGDDGQHAGGHLRVRRQDAGLRGPRPGDRPDYAAPSVGVIFYGTEGYVVLTSYTGGAAFDHRRQAWSRSSTAAATTSATSSRPCRSRKHQGPARRHPRRPPVQRPVPPGQHLVPPGRAGVGGRGQEAARQREEPTTTCWRRFDRTTAHLAANKVKRRRRRSSTVGPDADVRSEDRDVPRQRRGQRAADPRVPQAVRDSGGGGSLSPSHVGRSSPSDGVNCVLRTDAVELRPTCPAGSASRCGTGSRRLRR